MPDFNKFYNGNGISKLDQEHFDSMVNVDIHTETGSVTCRLALAADSSSNAPDEPCVQATAPTGTEYFFSTTSGKIWKRSTSGTYSVVTANANTTGHRGAQYYNGNIYYWTASKLGKFVFDTDGTRNDSFGTFSNANAYGSCEENLTLFIGDGKYVASVNAAGTFSANALDIPPQYTITDIIPDGFTNILIGTLIGSSVQRCRAFLWDTYSDSFTLSDEIPEIGINCFINADDTILAQCGRLGKLYEWTGGMLVIFDVELRGESTNVGHQMTTSLNARPLIAAGTKIYSVARKNRGLPRALVAEYTATDSITSIAVSHNTLLVSTASGINKTFTDRATATIDTPEVGESNNVIVTYSSLPSGTSIGILTNTNGAGWVTQTAITDTIRKQVYFDGGLAECQTLQARIVLNPSGSNAPTITNISIQ